MTQNRFYSSVSPPTTLAAAITSNVATTVVLNSVSGNPSSYPWTLLIDWGLTTQEAVSVTQAPTGAGPYTFSNVTRGIDGTVAQTHAIGAIAVHGVTAEDYNEPQVHMAANSGVHGIAGSVVGTTDAQTLTNKTLGATTFTGAYSLSGSFATGLLAQLANTHASPSNANVQWTAASAADNMLGVFISGDTNYRLQVNSSGKFQWGPGGASAVDTDLYRASAGVLETDTAFTVGTALTAATGTFSTGAAGGLALQVTNTTGAPTNENSLVTNNSSTDKAFGIRVSGDTVSRMSVLGSGKINWGAGGASVADTNLYRNAAGEAKTDNSLTVAGNLTTGGAQLTAGGTGVIGVNNASVAPSTTPSGGAVVYGKSGFVKWRGGDGADYNSGSFLATLATNTTGFASTSLTTVTGFSTLLGIGTYLVTLFVPYLPTGTIGSTSTFALSFTGTATGGSLGNFTVHNTPVQLTQNSSPSASFVSPTHTAAVTLAEINATFVVTVAGTLTGQASVQTGADTMTIFAGSFLEVQPVA